MNPQTQPKKEPNRLLQLFKEQPLMILPLIAAVALILIIIFSSRGSKGPKTDGDLPQPGYAAFLVYKDQAYFPFNNLNSDNLLRDDVAYFARKTMKDKYDNGKNVAVVFNVSSESSNDSTGEITLAGKFDKSKDKITIIASRTSNDRIKNHINNDSKNTSIDSELPSASKLNAFIATLPYQASNYYIEYIAKDSTINLLMGEKDPVAFQEAQNLIKDKTGVDDLSTISYSYSYPTGVEYGDQLTDESVPPKNTEY
ncbi:hypothetical protein KC930_01160 [Candidatus Saccharibacteria bacterium]|nr:hypothetical protein [Candidatus Saccharibacteria bacterium]